MVIPVRRTKENIDEQLGAIDMLAKIFYDDLRWLERFNTSIINDNAVDSIRSFALKYRYKETVTKSNVRHVIGELKGIVMHEMQMYVKASILQRVNEDMPGRKSGGVAGNSDPWGRED